MMHFLLWVEIVASAGAGIFWLWSSLVKIPDLMQTTLHGPGSITDILRRQSRLSAIAASCAAVAALAQAVLSFRPL
jgi:hypothetical protein